VKYVGRSNSQSLDPGLTINPCAETPVACPTPVHYDLTAETYWEHGASLQYQWPRVGQITIGVNNIFNAKPPTISDVPAVGFPTFGNYFLGGPYDYRGRSVFIILNSSFCQASAPGRTRLVRLGSEPDCQGRRGEGQHEGEDLDEIPRRPARLVEIAATVAAVLGKRGEHGEKQEQARGAPQQLGGIVIVEHR
jgi:hypothetical protein